MPYLATRTLGDTAQEHLDDHNALRALYNSAYAGDELQVLNVQDPPDTVTSLAAVGDGTTDDTDAIQAILDWSVGSRAQNHIVWFPFRNAAGNTATYLVSAPLRVWTQSTLVGGTGRRPATIRASSSFDWVTHPYSAHANYKPVGDATPGNIALIELWNDSTTRGGTSRIFIQGLKLKGHVVSSAVVAGSLGFWGKQQQNSFITDLRADDFETGFVTWGQQAKMERLQIGAEQAASINVGVYLGANFSGTGDFGDDDAKFFKFEELNVEYYIVAGIRTVADGPNWFNDTHFENLHAPLTATARAVDWQSGEANFTNTWSTHRGDDVIVVGDMTPPPGIIKATGRIRDWRNSDADLTYVKTFLDDRIRNKVIPVGSARNVEFLSLGFQNDTQADYDALATWLGDDGGEVRIGGLKGGTSAPTGHSGAQFTVIPNAAQDEPSVRFTDSANVLRAGVGPAGNLFVATFNNTTRPAATAVAAGTVIFNTDDNAPNFSDATNWRDAMGSVT